MVTTAANPNLIYVQDLANNLYTVDPKGGLAPTFIGRTSVQLSDIAVGPDGTLYGLSFTGLYRIDAATAALEFVGNHGLNGANALYIDANGRAIAGSSTQPGLYVMDLNTAGTTAFGPAGNTRLSAGDIAFQDGYLYMAMTDSAIDKFDLFTGQALESHATGVADVFGLVTFSGSRYAFAGTSIYNTNFATGATTLARALAGTVFPGNFPVSTIGGAAAFDFGQSGAGLLGAAAADILTGGALDDVINGLGGNDTLSGLDGNDTLIGNLGDDVLDGGIGSDTASYAGGLAVTVSLARADAQNTGGQGVDTLISIENLIGSANADTLTGDAVANTLNGMAGSDTLNGGEGDDILIGGAGADAMNGGTGRDRVDFSSATAGVVASLGSPGGNTGEAAGDTYTNIEILYGSGFADTLSVGNRNAVGTIEGTFEIRGGGGGDIITGSRDIMPGGQQADTLYGQDGDDTIEGLDGADLIDGGIGTDTATYANALAGVAVYLNGSGTNTGEAAGDVIVSIENLTGSAFADTLVGSNVANALNGGAGADTMAGGAGDDTYVVDNVGDVVNELPGGGADTVQASVSYTLSAEVENLVLTGSGAINATGNALANTLTGNSGVNILDGGGGSDVMAGGAGNDTYIVDNAGDVVTELSAQGTDLVQSSVSYTLSAFVENLTLTGAAAINATGNTLNNTLTGNAGDNGFDGGGGTDTMIGGAGNDTYVVDSTNDTVTELINQGIDSVQSSATYTLGANVENLTLLGSTAINGTGNGLDNILAGNSGANTLNGGAGNDTIDGGAAADIALFSATRAQAAVILFNGTTYVSSTADGRDVLTNVETLQFSGGTVSVASLTQFRALDYVAGYNDLAAAFGNNALSGVNHYRMNGFFEGRVADGFDGYQYVASYADLIAGIGANEDAAVAHFLQYGFPEGRSRDNFDAFSYLATNTDVLQGVGPNQSLAAAHYIQNGFAEHRSLDSFDELRYIASNADLITAFGTNASAATQHYVNNGFAEHRSTTAFNPLEYIASNTDLIPTIGTNATAAETQYITSGFAAHRPTAAFNATQYLANYSDLAGAFGTDLDAARTHFINYGFFEGRTDHVPAAPAGPGAEFALAGFVPDSQIMPDQACADFAHGDWSLVAA